MSAQNIFGSISSSAEHSYLVYIAYKFNFLGLMLEMLVAAGRGNFMSLI